MSSGAEYWVGPTIGEGAFGHVVYAVHKATERKVAIKVMEVPTTSCSSREGSHYRQNVQTQKTAMILNERRIFGLPELKSSKWIIDLWAGFCGTASSSSQCLYFVMKLATGGDLAGLIHRGLGSCHRLSWLQDSVAWYASQLIEAVQFLHSQGILHCDLKPENVLLDATTGRLMLADFGCSLDTNQQQQGKQQEEPQSLCPRGTAMYSSPEVLRACSPSQLTVAVDYWSLGCILHAMLHGSSPFDRGSEALTVRAIFGYTACGGSGTAREKGDPAENATCDELEADKSSSDAGEDHVIENTTRNKKSTHATPSTEMSAKNEDSEDHGPLQLLSQDLLAVIPDDRISAWKNNAIPFLSLISQGDDGIGSEDGDASQPPEKDGPPSDSGFATKNILLPIPDWQDEVANATLRDGNLGWFVFQI